MSGVRPSRGAGSKAWLCVLTLILVLSNPCLAKVLHVSKQGSDANNGLTWELAKLTINGALAVAENEDEIWVAKGEYHERIQIGKNVRLYGGFEGNEAALSERPPFPRPLHDPQQTIIDAAGEGTVVTITTDSVACRLDGFVICNGRGEAGGIYCRSSRAVFTNNIVRCNSGVKGGGIYCEQCSPAIVGNIIEYNYAPTGAAIGLNRASAYIGDNVIRNNAAYSQGAGSGGGIYCQMSSPSVLRNIITSNGADTGAALFVNGGSPVVGGNFIYDNSSQSGGTVSIDADSSPLLVNTLIVLNRLGAAVAANGERCNPRIINCTIVLNESYGVYFDNAATMEVGNSIVAYNGNAGISRGVRSWMSRLRLYNSCVYGNQNGGYLAGPNDQIDVSTLLLVSPSLVGSIDQATGNLIATSGHLLPDSPCIDAGRNEAIQPGWEDIDGETRIYNEIVDVGADEFIAPTLNGRFHWQSGDFASYEALRTDFEFRLLGRNEKRSVVVLIGQDGWFTVPAMPAERFTLSVKPRTWLRESLSLDGTNGTITGVNIRLVNGDADGDNEVTLGDFGILVAAFGSIPCDPNWDPGADFDGDGEVTLFDYGVLMRYFGLSGDE